MNNPSGLPALNCARADDHVAHDWDGKPLPARTPKFWCDPADPLADDRLAQLAQQRAGVSTETRAAVSTETVDTLRAAIEEAEYAVNAGDFVYSTAVDALAQAATAVLDELDRMKGQACACDPGA